MSYKFFFIFLFFLSFFMVGCHFRVDSYPPNAQVLIDHVPSGYVTPCSIPVKSVSVGHHSLTLKAEGYKPAIIPFQRRVSPGKIVLTVFFPVPCLFIFPFTDGWTKIVPKTLQASLDRTYGPTGSYSPTSARPEE